MKKQNEVITFKGGELISVLCEIEYILISLREIVRYYYQRVDCPPDENTRLPYALELAMFIEQSRVFDRLNNVRCVLSTPFDSGLGEDDMDDMDDIERETEKLTFWRRPGDYHGY